MAIHVGIKSLSVFHLITYIHVPENKRISFGLREK